MNLFLTNKKQKGDTESLLCPGALLALLGFGNTVHSPHLSRTYVTQPQPTFLTLNPSSSIPCVHAKLSQTQIYILFFLLCVHLYGS